MILRLPAPEIRVPAANPVHSGYFTDYGGPLVPAKSSMLTPRFTVATSRPTR